MKRLLSLFIVSLVAVTVFAQDDDGITSIKVSYKGNAPTITDFVDAILSEDGLGEALGLFDSYWQMYKKNRKMPPAVRLKIDKPNGFVSFSHNYAEDNSTLSVETCYWNCKDGRHKIVGQVIASYQNGRPVMGQYDGLMFYTYDSVTHRLKWTPSVDLCGEEFGEMGLIDGTVINLPSVGKNISIWRPEAGGTKHYLLKWTGSGFLFVAD